MEIGDFPGASRAFVMALFGVASLGCAGAQVSKCEKRIVDRDLMEIVALAAQDYGVRYYGPETDDVEIVFDGSMYTYVGNSDSFGMETIVVLDCSGDVREVFAGSRRVYP